MSRTPARSGTLPFTKMQGLGNDFVVLDARTERLEPDAGLLHRLTHRREGVGCDQVLLIGAPRDAGEDASFRIFNADGGEVEQCGNGVRCVARWLWDRGMPETTLRIGSPGGVAEARAMPGGDVRVAMGKPRFEPAEIPFDAPARGLTYAVEAAGRSVTLGAVSMGNPHAVLQVTDLEHAPVDRLGPALEHNPRFPHRVNVGFLQIRDRGHAGLRVWERGVGETRACGTGACAAMVWGRLAGLLDAEARIGLPGGTLVISWEGEGMPVYMTGPAVTVFEGHIQHEH